MPSRLRLPSIQNQYTQGRANAGGEAKSAGRNSAWAVLEQEMGQPAKTQAAASHDGATFRRRMVLTSLHFTPAETAYIPAACITAVRAAPE